ncbi:MAG TPA: GEVED domain-containing protein, partial [Bacteroidia bacterium]|nr:GEVED domain-containing protein [Bacteroidia bacterium]
TNNGFPNSILASASTLYGMYDGSSPVIENYINNNINNLYITGSSTSTSHSIAGIYNFTASGAKTFSGNNINNLTFTSSSTGASTVVGIRNAYCLTSDIYNNTIHTLSSTGATPTVAGILLGSSVATTFNVYNNIIGNLSTPGSTGMNLSGILCGAIASTMNLYYNTIYLNGTSTGTGFSSAAVYMSSTTPTVNLRNNILVNLSTPTGTGITAALRRVATALTGYATTSNNNLFYAGVPSATQVIYYDGTASYGNGTSAFGPAATAGTFQNQVATRESNSFTEAVSATPGVFFQSITGPATGTSATFLHMVNALTTLVESGGAPIGGITTDYDGNTRNITTPDVGADEFSGTSPAPAITFNSITPSTNQCVATSRLVSVNVTTPSGTITGVTITYNNGTLNSNIPMTNTVGNTWEYTIPAASPTNTTVTWSIVATNSLPLTSNYTGASYTDDPLLGVFGVITASVNPICAGSPSNLTAALYTTGVPAVPAASSYCQSTHTSGCSGDNMSLIVMNTMSSSASACGLSGSTPPRYLYTPGSQTTLTAGSNYSIAITFGTDVNQFFGAWMDYNHNGSYEASEFFASNSTTAGASGTATVNFTVPLTAYTGLTHMRIIGGNDAAVTSGQACGASSSPWGETQDYDVTIAGGLTNAPFSGAISTITWNDGTSNIGSSNPISVSPSIATTYTATIVSSGCNVTPNPSISLNIAAPPSNPTANNAAAQCPGVPLSSVTSTSGIPTPTFKWYSAATGGTMLQQSTSTTYTTSISTTTTFHVSEIDLVTGCESGRVPVVCSVHTLSITSGVPNFCSSGGAQTTTLTAVSSNGSFTYAWSGTSGTIVPSTGSPVTINITATTDYTLTATDGACVMTASKTIGVYDFPSINLSSNGPVCEGSTISLNSGIVAGSFTAACITPPAGLATPGPGAVQLCNAGAATVPLSGGTLDDGYWNAIPIPFTFNYFGTGYTSLNIGTNGNVNFGASGTTQYNFTGGFPSLSNPANTIAVCARDLQLGATGGSFSFGTGKITYWTEGVTPNRKFIVQYANCATWYSTNASDGYSSAEAVFYETIGSVDIRVIAATNPAATSGTFINDTRNKYIGLQDGTRTVGATSPNCNTLLSNYWNGVADEITTPQAWRFDPASHYTITWTGTNLVPPTTGTDLFTIATTAMNTPGTYNYTFVGTDQTTGCTNSLSPANLNVVVTPLPVAPVVNGTTICGASSVTLTVSNAASIAPALINWYDAPVGGTLLFTGASYITPVISGSTSYYVESLSGTCANSGGRTQVNINVISPPLISASGPGSQVCPGDPITLNVTSSNGGYTYVWNPGSLAGAAQNINAPASTTTYTVVATDNTAGPFATCTTSSQVIVNVHNTPTPNAGADQLKNIGTTANLLATYISAPTCLKITEITLNRFGIGTTPTYPAYATGQDLVEITNLGTTAINIDGLHFKTEGSVATDYVFPAATVPAGGVVVVNVETGTNDIPNLSFFTNTGGDVMFSGSANGIWLTTASGEIIDAVATNAHTFSPGSGVTAADWNGAGASGISGDAGTRLTGADLNDATNWITAGSSTQNIGTINSGLPSCTPPTYTVTWSGGNLVAPVVANPVTTPVFIAPPQTYTYSVSLNDGVCTTTDNVDITTQMPLPPTADFTVNSTSQTTGYTTSTATFTDISLNVPDTWLWNITGPGTVTYVNSTTTASQNPQVQFGAVGQYTVALTVTNAAGNDTKTQTNYITVTATYCPSNATNTADEEIYGVIFAGISNPSTCATTGGAGSILNEYSNYTGIAPGQAAVGYTYPFTLNTSACGTGTYSAGYSVFIDFNGDGDFVDLDEKVLGSVTTTPIPPGSPAGSVITQFTGNVVIPATATLGLTRMRVTLQESNATPLACGTYGYGETEDYTINLFAVTAAPNCVASSTSNFTCITAPTISWPAASGYPTGYYVSYGLTPAGNDLGTINVGNVTTATLPTLNASTLYYYLIEPYNAIGTATGCTVSSNTTGGSVTQTPTQSSSSYTETIDNSVAVPALPCGMTGSDENFPNDGVTWKSANGAGNAHAGTRYLSIDKNPNNTTAKDDWFYSAPMNLTAGKLYRIYFWHRVGAAGSENFEVFLSNSNDAATMLTTSAVFNGASNLLTYKLDSSADILPVVGGIYYYGFHANGAANGQSLYMDDIQVKQIPVAAMDPASCVTIPSLYDQLLVQPVYQAQDYKFKIENLANSFSYEYTRNLPIPDFRLKWAPGVTYDLTYDVSVSYKKNNVWSPYGPSCPVTMGPFPTTQLRGASCGA